MRRNPSMRGGYDPVTVAALTASIRQRVDGRRTPLLVGLSGLQGSGKSTLASQLVDALAAIGTDAMTISLDDFYLGRGARARLARDVHPLLATRGVPGTHDLVLLVNTLDALTHADARTPARVPRFDKGRDTRVVPSRWRQVTSPPRAIVLEGWCIGVPPEPAHSLREGINALERGHDADGRWRNAVNAELAGEYAALWTRLDLLIALVAPDFDVVTRWRDEQERALRRRGAPHAMSRAAVGRFIAYYERLSQQALNTLPARADVVVALDADRRVLGVTRQARRPKRASQ